MKTTFLIASCCLALVFFGSILFIVAEETPAKPHTYVPAKGYVPDAETAKKIAEAVWLPIYGDSVLHQKPYTATLVKKGIWRVHGNLAKQQGGLTNMGGTAEIEINKQDGKILRVSHGK